MAVPNVEKTYLVKQDQIAWLQTMASQFNIPNEHKALRVLIDFGMKHGDLNQIFKKIHCLRCNSDTVVYAGPGYKRILKHRSR